MPRNFGPSSSRYLLALIIAILVFSFTPISKSLLRSVNGSFSPTRFSSLALRSPSAATNGIVAGTPVEVRLTNQTGEFKTYHWRATQNGALISLGEEAVKNGGTTSFSVPSHGTVKGALRITITGTTIFITVPIRKS